jgi:hypothetical protein
VNWDWHLVRATGGWWHHNLGGQAHSNGWSGIGGMVSNTWFPWCHSICSVPVIIMSRPPLSSLHWFVPTPPDDRWRVGRADEAHAVDLPLQPSPVIIKLFCQVFPHWIFTNVLYEVCITSTNVLYVVCITRTNVLYESV